MIKVIFEYFIEGENIVSIQNAVMKDASTTQLEEAISSYAILKVKGMYNITSRSEDLSTILASIGKGHDRDNNNHQAG